MLTALVSSCDKDDDTDPDAETTVYGESVPMESGTLHSWAKIDAAGNPTAVGFSFSHEVLHSLPGASHENADPNSAMTMYYYEVDLPSEIKDKTPFDHVAVDWNPMGHPPEIYSVPHFDGHFYMISSEQQMQIGDEVSDPKVLNVPPSKYLPADYIDIQVNVPEMGKHWVDKFTAELNGGEFTQTLIYGSYDSKVIFYEPMFTLDYLQSNPKDTFSIKQPAEFERKGLYYPTKYIFNYNAETGEYTIALTDFELKN
ncbi:DUF5602 domain-containing protein [Pontibacter silvestris]|uniref:DUF5602 domain-containing protein n=1 Tax=Pontibacter silvestris TaxID=2305183 RepID=A0ABW4WZC6_9BACT|nr:DUF5602 domain-containing protein [Pontibacter silvestris]MCC9137680.1 DUF5602 domain-containing protein [Pontibacter silvestris]